jgi:hypothetical protein
MKMFVANEESMAAVHAFELYIKLYAVSTARLRDIAKQTYHKMLLYFSFTTSRKYMKDTKEAFSPPERKYLYLNYENRSLFSFVELFWLGIHKPH